MTMELPPILEETDPELAGLFQQIATGKLLARVEGDRVFKKLYPTDKQGIEVVAPLNIGRNDPCFCGSGKKFKKCCGTGK